MTPHEFITKWRASELKERSASQEHFIDLCRLLGQPTPAEADPTGERYCFERGARRDSGRDGWADVWKRHHFAWEYKGHRANLNVAFDQLRQYALALHWTWRRWTDGTPGKGSAPHIRRRGARRDAAARTSGPRRAAHVHGGPRRRRRDILRGQR